MRENNRSDNSYRLSYKFTLIYFLPFLTNQKQESGFQQAIGLVTGQVDSPELPKTPENTEMTENFTKVTKYLTKFKETLINHAWEKPHVKKQ